ncbi:hypothetical protein Nlim_1070 [Candidatus Nitrosarchaeum limnium SFB1]|jgi:hypothetical protein|uniref:Uncharacterized protein n=1 Tax=Candidatus Nitrosarchaeum limnium SFB1 TaxID=886738 RepID=F3KKP6_9ARCH|nr:hypothetical protein Nlim_1070 [Candidatus Nitrosarchaeum limnium SFB1]
MNSIYSIISSQSKLVFGQVWTENQNTEIANGYTAMIPINIGKDVILFAYNKNAQKTDTFRLTNSAPWVSKVDSQIDLSDGQWDSLNTFVLGNNNYLMTYQKDNGVFGFYQITDDLQSSKPFKFSNSRETPTTGFTTIVPLTSLDQQYFLGYDFDLGKVASFSLMVKTSSWNSPPLRAQNIWYHQWSPGWTHFAFFKLGETNFFFKINKKRLNVNIDHILDDPANGGIPIGTHLEKKLPNADSISNVVMIPWENGEPYLLTYINTSGSAIVYKINADCKGFVNIGESITQKNVSMIIPYCIGNKTFTLFYGGQT